jgi:hypothetical protein|tara:strand:+ start:11924 stop:12208 length:285 start_codon:yes stop_codon:yes gene_type:complete
MNDNKTLFERACTHIIGLEDLEKDLSLQAFMDTEEIMSLSLSYYDFARDGMPKEIVEFILGNIHIGYIMGRMACGEDSNYIIPDTRNSVDWTGE